jgi:hypothetical protein
VGLADGQVECLDEQYVHVDFVRALRGGERVGEGDADIDPFFAERGLNLVLGQFERAHGDTGIARAEALQQGTGEVVGDGGHAQPQGAATEILQLVDGAPAGIELHQGAPSMAQVHLPRIGQPNAASRGIQQLNLEQLLQLLDLLRKVGCETCRTSAARVTLRCSATANR